MAPTNTNPIDFFPHPVLTKIDGMPNRANLKILERELRANAKSVFSSRGNGTHGHLRFLYGLAAYNALPAVAGGAPFVDPAHPGAAPPMGGTAAQIQQANDHYLRELNEFTLFTATQEALKRQFTQAINPTFYSILEDEDDGYSDVNLIDLMDHVKHTYGAITADDLAQNVLDMERQWSPPQPLEDLFQQIKKCREYARLLDPISEPAAVRSAIKNLEASGVFHDALKRWRRLALPAQGWDPLVDFFVAANTERLRELSSGQAGYHGRGAANAATEDKENTNPSKSTSKSSTVSGFCYCWTHGLSRGRDHTSKNCSKPDDDHQVLATIDNMLGGNWRIQREKGVQQIWKPKPPRGGYTNNRDQEPKKE